MNRASLYVLRNPIIASNNARGQQNKLSNIISYFIKRIQLMTFFNNATCYVRPYVNNVVLTFWPNVQNGDSTELIKQPTG